MISTAPRALRPTPTVRDSRADIPPSMAPRPAPKILPRQATRNTHNTLLNGAEQFAPVRVEADFSYTNQSRYGIRYACCGDAAGFLDPVFSSGVFLAFTSAARVADQVHLGLQEGREADPLLHAGDDEAYLLGFNTMRLFVERFYQSNIVHNLFFEADRDPELKDQIARLLSGDLWADNNALQQNLLAGRRMAG